MNLYHSIRQQREPVPPSPPYRFLEKFRQGPENMWNKQSIYRIPTLIRELDPKAYEPRVVSIGPYHYGKEELEPMDEHKHRAIKHYLNRTDSNIRFDDVLAEFREEGFLEKVMNCYAKPLDQQWCYDHAFLHLMVLDGCFVFELLLSALDTYSCPRDSSPQIEWCYAVDDPIFGAYAERHGVVPYVKMDMLLLENQIPLIVLEKLARIAHLEVDINGLIRTFYGCNGRQNRPNQLGLHVLDVYRKGRLSYGDYKGWAVPKSAKELNEFGIHFERSSGGGTGDGSDGIGSFKDVTFEKRKEKEILGKIYDHFLDPVIDRQPQVTSSVSGFFRRVIPLRVIPSISIRWRFPCARQTTEWYIISAFLRVISVILSAFCYVTVWWYLPLWVTKGTISLPFLTIDETTAPILLNLMAFERLHLGREARDMAVTHYVFLMSSLVRAENDVERLRKKSVLSCVPGRSDESVVKLFADVTKNVVLDDIRGMGVINRDIEAFCKRRPNRLQAAWLRTYGSDLKTWVTVVLTLYGVAFGLVSTVMSVLNYVVTSNRKPILCN